MKHGKSSVGSDEDVEIAYRLIAESMYKYALLDCRAGRITKEELKEIKEILGK